MPTLLYTLIACRMRHLEVSEFCLRLSITHETNLFFCSLYRINRIIPWDDDATVKFTPRFYTDRYRLLRWNYYEECINDLQSDIAFLFTKLIDMNLTRYFKVKLEDYVAPSMSNMLTDQHVQYIIDQVEAYHDLLFSILAVHNIYPRMQAKSIEFKRTQVIYSNKNILPDKESEQQNNHATGGLCSGDTMKSKSSQDAHKHTKQALKDPILMDDKDTDKNTELLEVRSELSPPPEEYIDLSNDRLQKTRTNNTLMKQYREENVIRKKRRIVDFFPGENTPNKKNKSLESSSEEKPHSQ
ncbi:hypothetical protein BDB01DRAFT_907105 [Pilobolus umbonatus]|nr:hypothetical protein BDB01DRAFT_907105 [Pilobolus umbonatus]